MSIESTVQTGITDPTLQWVTQAELLHSAPGINPTEALERKEELTPAGGFLLLSTVHLGSGIASTQMHIYQSGELRLFDPVDPGHMYGVSYATAELAKPAFSSSLLCGNLADKFSDYDSPGHGEFLAGDAAVTAVHGSGYFVATTEAHPRWDTRFHVKSYNPLEDPGFSQRSGYQPAQLARVVFTKRDALEVAAAIGKGAGLDEVQQALYVAKANEQLARLSWAQYEHNVAQRHQAERGRFATYVAGVLNRRLGIGLTDKA